MGLVRSEMKHFKAHVRLTKKLVLFFLHLSSLPENVQSHFLPTLHATIQNFIYAQNLKVVQIYEKSFFVLVDPLIFFTSNYRIY